MVLLMYLEVQVFGTLQILEVDLMEGGHSALMVVEVHKTVYLRRSETRLAAVEQVEQVVILLCPLNMWQDQLVEQGELWYGIKNKNNYEISFIVTIGLIMNTSLAQQYPWTGQCDQAQSVAEMNECMTKSCEEAKVYFDKMYNTLFQKVQSKF